MQKPWRLPSPANGSILLDRSCDYQPHQEWMDGFSVALTVIGRVQTNQSFWFERPDRQNQSIRFFVGTGPVTVWTYKSRFENLPPDTSGLETQIGNSETRHKTLEVFPQDFCLILRLRTPPPLFSIANLNLKTYFGILGWTITVLPQGIG